MADPLITHVSVRNFKSIAKCDVDLKKLSILVGPNASGKSNFLEAIDFISESLNESLEYALRQRGGINEVRRRAAMQGRPTDFSIALECDLGDAKAEYLIKIAAVKPSLYRIAHERCTIAASDAGHRFAYEVVDGKLTQPPQNSSYPKHSRDKLYLAKNLGDDLAERLFEYLVDLRFYDLNPSEMKELQPPDSGELLDLDGWNIASVWRRMVSEHPVSKNRVIEYLSKIVPGLIDVRAIPLGPKETLEFVQDMGKGRKAEFFASSMSEGTMRSLGLLIALFQQGETSGSGTHAEFIAFEEPEKAVNPAVMGVLLDAIREASAHRQVLLTSHSPDLLDREDVDVDGLIAVAFRDGETIIGRVNVVGREALRDELYTVGELMRMNYIVPEGAEVTA